jgi:hypothetical protein
MCTRVFLWSAADMTISCGDTIRTQYLTGRVLQVVEGRDRGWEDTAYYYVEIIHPTRPSSVRGNKDYVRLNEVVEVFPCGDS